MGNTGPCGPCSEIHYYTGDTPEKQSARKINADDPEYIELWNLVFIQYYRDDNRKLHDLPKKHVDTGAGLERLVAVLQGKKSNYESDLLRTIIDRIAELTGIAYQESTGMPHRVIADHIRMLAFSLADGGMPSNEGRGYVMRRILRRASRFARMLEMHDAFLYRLVDTVGEIYGTIYPEIIERKEHIEKVIRAEEETFSDTLDRGLEHFEKIVRQMDQKKHKIISGADVFKLYDTYGFPFDLTRLIAAERGYEIDEEGFYNEMEKQRMRARSQRAFQRDDGQTDKNWVEATSGEDSAFIGYDHVRSEATIRHYAIEGEKVNVILDRTPFYAESGGQVGDTGRIYNDDFEIDVQNTTKQNHSIVHHGKFVRGRIDAHFDVKTEISDRRIKMTRLNHTATHLLHAALRQVLGEHVHQAGSLVEPERLRFDLTHYTKISEEELAEIEQIVNRKIRENIKLETEYKDFDEAKKEGAMALFGEKYDEIVRVVNIEGFSQELCGGTHVDRTGDIGYCKIVSESSVAAGIRRIEAITGDAAVAYSQQRAALVHILEQELNAQVDQIMPRIADLQQQLKTAEKRVKKQVKADTQSAVTEQLESSQQIGAVKLFTQLYSGISMDELKSIGDSVREKIGNGVGVLASVTDDKPMVVVVVADVTIQQHAIKAGDMVKVIGRVMGGGGGGRPHLATAGGKRTDRFDAVFEEARKYIEKIVVSN